MSARYRFLAFLAGLLALVSMFGAACVLAYHGKSVEALGISGVLTGIIGILGFLAGSKQSPDQVEITNTERNPAIVEEAHRP